MEFMPEHAPLAVMAFLGTTAFLAVAATAALASFWMKRKWIGIAATILAFLLTGGYALVLVGVSLTSHEETLAPGESKYFCEIDCHVAYSLVNFEEASALGDELQQTLPAGRFVIIGLQTWFDPSTISEHRGDGPLAPNPRHAVLVDDTGQQFLQSRQGQSALAKIRGVTPPLSQPLRPGESYVTDLVFEVPDNAHNLRLFVGDDFAIPDRLLIGHENSFLHKRIFLALAAPGTVQAGRMPR
jgi:hypothetical protein